jgi:TRAP-type C4-dicarboxylate transport system permease small subunit
MQAKPGTIRTALDWLYRISGGLAAVSLLLILGLIVTEMIARWTGFSVPGSSNYAGYSMAAAAHIRVNLFLSRLGRYRRIGEIWCFAVGAVLVSYFAYYAVKTTYWSYKLNDISQGQDATPIWIPQLAMCLGTTVFAIAMIDRLHGLLTGKLSQSAEQAIEDHHME